MNNSGAIYIEHPDHHAVISELSRQMQARGFVAVERDPTDCDPRIMIPAKRLRHFLVMPAVAGWVVIWEDPGYFAERPLAQALAANLGRRAIWIEVSGNGVSWAYGHYDGSTTLDEQYSEVKVPYYGEYGSIFFAFNPEHTPEEFIAKFGLPYDSYDYARVVAGDLPAATGAVVHLAFEK
ncbi:hypothetical protein OSCT_1263 [Oscillochloris trichoides DG-6]|uniref:Uncharacterized protein n=1 Tax=Oscillochloris trichoides DG-6 TaxID=765420 RepID=E1ID62_9CHLR|nr:hypothetical protein [Oscillochloris trichoides]EFO80894.1 hypothetical protein OSCT_1263 [Oscillochloris trichoides DG-6]